MARLFVDNLTVIDFSYLDADRGIVGESWIVDIELSGELDDQGMVFDFGKVKKKIKQYIDNEIDHCLLVPMSNTGCTCKLNENRLSVEFPLASGAVISHLSPQDAVLLVNSMTINKEHVADELQTAIKGFLPKNVSNVKIGLRSEVTNNAFYHYTHGLQKHTGQCQRIAHGHRSRIKIWINQQRDKKLENRWATILKDCYIATNSHIIEDYNVNGIEHTRLSYIAQQGEFTIGLPSSSIFTMPTESTVENIAQHLAAIIADENQASVLVKAYEGIAKGAYGEAKVVN